MRRLSHGSCDGTSSSPKSSMLAVTSPSLGSSRRPHRSRPQRRRVLGVHVISAESTELFTGPPDAPLQLVRVTHTGGAVEVRVEGEGLTTPAPVVADAADGTVEVPV